MRPRQKKKPLADINVVPYIDVMLVLLVIFMITTPMLTQGVHVDLPQANAKPISSKDNLPPIIVSVNAKGDYFLNTDASHYKPMSQEQLILRVSAELLLAKRAHKTRAVMVKGDNFVHYGKVVKIMALLQQAGVKEVGLVTQTPKTKKHNA